MTQIWVKDKLIAVTPVLAGPCVITQIKTKERDKYTAWQLAFGTKKEKNIKKPQRLHFKKAGINPAHVREFRLEEDREAELGDVLSLKSFAVGDIVSVTGVSKGKGFQGVVKRHKFKGSRKSHGNKDQLRMPGSIGEKGPARVYKGKKMAGRMGNDKISINNLEIIDIDIENNILYVKGGLPGAIDSLLIIKSKNGEMELEKVNKELEVKEEVKEVKEEEIKGEKAKEDVKEEAKEDAEEAKEEKKEEEGGVKKEDIKKEEKEEEKEVKSK